MRSIPFFTPRLTPFIFPLMGCAATAVPPPGGTAVPAPVASTAAADFQFVRGMIEHHAQALAMTALVPERSSRSAIRLLAERLDVSQRDEIAQLRDWLTRRGEPAPSDATREHDPSHSHGSMPGMRTPEQLARLKATRAAEFDRLFLEHMIAHHEGALVMIRELFAVPGAGQDPEIFRFASEIETDQRIEITRMQQMLAAMPGGDE